MTLQGSEELVKKARKVLLSTQSHTGSFRYLLVNVLDNLFDTMVKPIALYSSEITYKN